MSIYDTIYNDMKTAMKEKNQQRVLLIRGLMSLVKNNTINLGKELTDDATIASIKKTLKEIDQSIMSFREAGRTDVIEKFNQDKEYLQRFLPKQLSEEEIEVIVKASIAECNATSKKDMGKVMKTVMSKTNGAADGKIVSKIVANCLN